MSKEAELDKLQERQIAHAGEMMEYLELIDIGHPKMPFKERIQFMIMLNTIIKDGRRGKDEPDAAGSKVRKYAKGFADASARRPDYAGRDTDDDDAELPVRSSQPS